MFYFAVFKINNNEYGLYVKVHHIISDAWGTITQISKIVEKYSNLKHGIKTGIQEESSYIDFIESENEYINSEKYKKSKNFWKTKFETIPEFMSLKATGTKYKNTKAARKTFVLTKEMSSSINEFCAANRCSPFAVFFAVLFTYISRITSKSDIVLGTPILNRSNAKEKNMVGMFINVLPVRLNVDPNADFITFIKYLSGELLTLIRNQRYPFSLIQNEFRNRHNLSANLIDVVLSYQNAKIDRTEFTGDYRLVWQENGYQVNSLQIHVNDREGEGEYTVDFDYLVDVFEEYEINGMISHFINLLSDAIEQPTKLLCELNMLSVSEKKQIVEKFNDTYKEYPKDKTIHELLEEQVQKNPNNIALVYEDKTLTYAELNSRANVIAHVLREKGIKPDDIVGIMVERSIEMIVGILGILKAGGAYLPLDNSYPEERINYMIKDSGCKIILIKTDSYINVDFDGEYIFIDKEILHNKTASNIKNVCTSDNLAYLIYTSGSTGTPKGVMVEHRGIANLKIFFEENMGITFNDRIMQFFSCSFDAFVWEIFMALLTGASLYIVSRDVINNYIEFEKFLSEKKISVVTLPPFYLANLNPDNITSLKKLVTAGSSINYGLMKKWSNKVIYFNAYGPTETTICASVWRCEDPNVEMSTVPIGRPIYNTKIFIVERGGCGWRPGELCIAGDICRDI